jgi:hypothetical protein
MAKRSFMRKFYILWLLVISITAQAQVGKGKSIYINISFKNADLNSFESIEKFKFSGTEPNTNVYYTYTLKKTAIEHSNPAPFIAFSCRWEEVNASPENSKLSIRFSKNGNQWTTYKEITKDNHFEGPKNHFVSELDFIDKDYKFYQVQVVTNLNKEDNQIENLKLNFFNPYGERDAYDIENLFKQRSCSSTITMMKLIEKYEQSQKKEKNTTSTTQLLKHPPIQNTFKNIDFEKQLKLDYTGTQNPVDITIPQGVDNTNSCPCPLPAYITRTQWNCPQGQGIAPGVVTNPAVTHLIVHHSAGNNTAADWNAVVLSIWNFHTGTNGYSDIGYNWLVAPNGVLYEGRGSGNLNQNVQGAHFCGFNQATMGTCMIGTFTLVDITTAARTTLSNILAWKACQAGIPAIGTALHASSGLTLNRISGHRDGCATDCPGTTFYNTLPTVRTDVDAVINACNPVVPCTASLQINVTGCPNNTLNFTPINIQNGGTAPTFAWYLNNTFVQNGASYTLNNAINTDKVFAKMTSNAACATPTQVNSDTLTISCIVTTAIIDIDGLQYCRISPNPNNGIFAVQMQLTKTTTLQYRLLDAMGKQIFVTNKERQVGVINKSFHQKNLAAGLYSLEILFNNKPMVYKIVVQ